jgi:uncharacterized damage-inducible protein DinB
MIAAGLSVVLSCGLAVGQMKTGAEPGKSTSPAKAVDSQVSLIENEMMGAVRAMPAERFGFAPSAAIFAPGQKTEFATVRTFAQQVTHVAAANYFFYAAVSGLKPDVDEQSLNKIATKEQAVAALAGSFAFAHKAVATLTPGNSFESVSIQEPGVYTRVTLAEFAVGHAFDHYGQMVEYLRMNGLVPPASAPGK